MKRLFIIISFVIIALYLHAQNNLLLETPDSTGYSVSFNSLLVTSTNGFNKNFIQAVNQSNYLSDNLKSSNPIKEHNYIQYHLNEEISLYRMNDSLFGMEKMGYHFGISYQQLFTSAFNKDLYNLIAFGNKNYAGKEAHLSQSLFQYFDYGTLSVFI